MYAPAGPHHPLRSPPGLGDGTPPRHLCVPSMAHGGGLLILVQEESQEASFVQGIAARRTLSPPHERERGKERERSDLSLL